jgi:beta-glucanase (GH16 family)
MRPASLLRRFGALVGAAAIVLAAWPTPFAGNGGDPAVVLPSAASTAGPAPSANGTSAPGTPMPTEDLGRPAFAEECTSELQPEWQPITGTADPGFGLDSDFLGSLRQVSVRNGVCIITAARADTPSGRPYASAAMSIRRAFSQRYGTFEIRVRYPAGQGLWPAFWLVEDVGADAEPFEVDVFEAYPGHRSQSSASGPTQIASTLHFPGGRHSFVHDHGTDLTTDFHTHRLTWSAGLMVFAIDGVETGRITRDVPDVPMYPVVNLAVGAPGYRVDDTTPFVALMEIDYIRIWAP